MDNIAVKKIELINWLTKLQDEQLLNKIDTIRESSLKENYLSRMSESLGAKLDRSEEDVIKERLHTQEAVEDYFKRKNKT